MIESIKRTTDTVKEQALNAERMIDGSYSNWEFGNIERIVCAANLLEDQVLILGARHCDVGMLVMLRQIKGSDANFVNHKCKQGFYTNRFRFVDRKEGMLIAKAANQIVRENGTYDQDVLYSECLY